MFRSLCSYSFVINVNFSYLSLFFSRLQISALLTKIWIILGNLNDLWIRLQVLLLVCFSLYRNWFFPFYSFYSNILSSQKNSVSFLDISMVNNTLLWPLIACMICMLHLTQNGTRLWQLHMFFYKSTWFLLLVLFVLTCRLVTTRTY